MPESENPDASEKYSGAELPSDGWPVIAGSISGISGNPDQESNDASGASGFVTGGNIREGSPFAVDPEPLSQQHELEDAPVPAEVFYDIGPMRYMALGAVLAAAVVLLFSAASAYWFPAGGILVAGLGCFLAFLGFFSPRPRTAGGLLIVHLCLFVTAYVRMLG